MSYTEDTNEVEEQNDDYNVDGLNISGTVQNIDPLLDIAYFLLRVSQEQSLTHSGIENFCDSMDEYKEVMSGKIREQVEQKLRHHGCVMDEVILQDILRAVEVDDHFSVLKSRYIREMYYEQHFNYNVR